MSRPDDNAIAPESDRLPQFEETRGIRALACEILRGAITDVASRHADTRATARAFLLNERCRPLLQLWCDAAGIDVAALRDRVRNMLVQDEQRGGPTPRRRVAAAPSPAEPDVSHRRARLLVGAAALFAAQRRSQRRQEHRDVEL